MKPVRPVVRLGPKSVLLSLALVMGACGGDGDSLPAAPTFDPNIALLTPAQVAHYQEERTSEFQATLIQDGRLTLAEYESAALAYKQCIEAAGHSLTSPFEMTGMGKYVFMTFSPHSADASALPRCWDEHLNEIDEVWSNHAGRNPEVQRIQEEATAEMAICIRDGGVDDFPEHPSSGDYLPLFQETHPQYSGHQDLYFGCRQRIADQYKLPAFFG